MTGRMKKIGLLGGGGQADEVEAYVQDSYKVVFRAVDSQYIDVANKLHIDISNPPENKKDIPVIAAVGPSAVRKRMVESWSGTNYATVRSKFAYIDTSAVIGSGTVIAPGAVITTNVEIGRHCIINISATISHNATLGDYVTVSPGANIAGNVKLGDGVFVGIGATISNGVKLANGVVVGAGAVVIDDVIQENQVVVGIPAKPIKRNKGWLNEI